MSIDVIAAPIPMGSAASMVTGQSDSDKASGVGLQSNTGFIDAKALSSYGTTDSSRREPHKLLSSEDAADGIDNFDAQSSLRQDGSTSVNGSDHLGNGTDENAEINDASLSLFDKLVKKSWFKTFVAGAGFCSDAYDLFVIDTVMNVLAMLYGQTADQKAFVANAAVVGAVIGQIFFGFAGDVIGRRVCFIVTSMLIICGALLSATAFSGSSVSIYTQLAIWRGILGFGVGGEYPLSATISSEGATHASRGRSVVAVFAMQGIGKLLGSLINYLVLACGATYVTGGLALDASWRFALAFGAVPALLTVYFRWRLEESPLYRRRIAAAERAKAFSQGTMATRPSVFSSTYPAGRAVTVSDRIMHALKNALPPKSTWSMLAEYKWLLIGTAGTWFLLDVTFYGQALMQTTVVQTALGFAGFQSSCNGAGASPSRDCIDSLVESALGSLVVVSIALPGYALAFFTIDRLGRRGMQLMGFTVCLGLYILLATALNALRQTVDGAGFVFVYGLTYLFSNWGANTTTFIVPSEAFPTRIRSTAHGLSAAAGKAGAAIGSASLILLYHAPATLDAGVVLVMWTCAGVSGAGLLLTWWLTIETRDTTLEEVDASSKVEAELAIIERAAAATVINNIVPNSNTGDPASPVNVNVAVIQ